MENESKKLAETKALNIADVIEPFFVEISEEKYIEMYERRQFYFIAYNGCKYKIYFLYLLLYLVSKIIVKWKT